MRKELDVIGEPPKQALKASLEEKRMIHAVYVPPSTGQNEYRIGLIERAQKAVRLACPLGKVGCEAEVDLTIAFGHIIDPNIFCYKVECPFQDNGGSGDREPLNAPSPTGGTAEVVSLESL